MTQDEEHNGRNYAKKFEAIEVVRWVRKIHIQCSSTSIRTDSMYHTYVRKSVRQSIIQNDRMRRFETTAEHNGTNVAAVAANESSKTWMVYRIELSMNRYLWRNFSFQNRRSWCRNLEIFASKDNWTILLVDIHSSNPVDGGCVSLNPVVDISSSIEFFCDRFVHRHISVPDEGNIYAILDRKLATVDQYSELMQVVDFPTPFTPSRTTRSPGCRISSSIWYNSCSGCSGTGQTGRCDT